MGRETALDLDTQHAGHEHNGFSSLRVESTVPLARRTPETRDPREDREHLEQVLACFDYLLEESRKAPEDRDPNNVILAIVDPIADIFEDECGSKENREGGLEINGTKARADVNGGGGLNLVTGLAPFASEVHVITRVGDSGYLPGVTRQIIDSFPEHVRKDGVVTQHGARDSIKIRWSYGTTEQDQTALRKDAPPLDDATTHGLRDAISATVAHNPHIRKVGITEYGRNTLTPAVLDALNQQIEQGQLLPSALVYDPRADNPDLYEMFNVYGALLTPNREELARMIGSEISKEVTGEELDNVAHEAAAVMFRKFPRIGGVLETFDRDGAYMITPDGVSIHMPATIHPSEFKNSSGGGDTVDATMLLLPDSFPLEARVHAAMYTGGLAVSKRGTTTLSPELVRDARAKVATELAFRRGYKYSTDRNNKGFLPEVAAPVIAAELGRPDLEDDILGILKSPQVDLYEDTEPFAQQVVATGDHFAFYTQGQGETVIDAHSPLAADNGYQVSKIRASGLPEVLGATWEERARERGLPKVVGGIDKRQSLEGIASTLLDASQVVFVDDKLENVAGATDTLAARGIPAFGILVDRKGRYGDMRGQLPDHIIAVDNLSQVPVEAVSSGDKKTTWMVDWDETSADHEYTKDDLKRRIWRLSLEGREEELQYAAAGA